jgi:hypothetical protein
MKEDQGIDRSRRRLLQIAGAAGTGLAAADVFSARRSTMSGQQRSSPKDTSMRFDPTLNTADLLVDPDRLGCAIRFRAGG